MFRQPSMSCPVDALSLTVRPAQAGRTVVGPAVSHTGRGRSSLRGRGPCRSGHSWAVRALSDTNAGSLGGYLVEIFVRPALGGVGFGAPHPVVRRQSPMVSHRVV